MTSTNQTVTVTHLGCPGHLIVARYCRWHRHTQIDGPGGSWRVSTIGNYYIGDQLTTVAAGPGDYFETMAFPTAINGHQEASDGCGCRPVLDWTGINSRRYETAGEAQAGHEQAVAGFAARAARSEAIV